MTYEEAMRCAEAKSYIDADPYVTSSTSCYVWRHMPEFRDGDWRSIVVTRLTDRYSTAFNFTSSNMEERIRTMEPDGCIWDRFTLSHMDDDVWYSGNQEELLEWARRLYDDV